MQILCFINAANNKPRNPLTFCADADPGTKCCDMQKAKKGAQKCDTKHPAIHFLFFASCDCFHVFCDKCIAGLRVILYKKRIFKNVFSTNWRRGPRAWSYRKHCNSWNTHRTELAASSVDSSWTTEHSSVYGKSARSRWAHMDVSCIDLWDNVYIGWAKKLVHLGFSNWVTPKQFFAVSSENTDFPRKLFNMIILSTKFVIKMVVLIFGVRWPLY